MNKEIFLLSAHSAAIATALAPYGVEATATPNVTRLMALLENGQTPSAVYLDDTLRGIDDNVIRRMAKLAQTLQVAVIVQMFQRTEAAESLVQNVEDMSGFARISDRRTPDAIVEAAVEFIASTLQLQRETHAAFVPICVAGAKGGIGKTFLIAQIAVGLAQRGVRVLVVDSDLTNSGLIPHFRIPRGYTPYTSLERDTATSERFTPDRLRKIIYQHPDIGVHFLLGTDDQNVAADLRLNDWLAMMFNVLRLSEYDVALVDTGPDINRRPYALEVLSRMNGWAVIPAPPGSGERYGLETLMGKLTAYSEDALHRCMIVLMEPERGSQNKVETVTHLVKSQYPKVDIIGRMPRDAYIVSLADAASEESGRFVSPLELGPHRQLCVETHNIVEAIAQKTGMYLPNPKPSSAWWKQILSRIAPDRFLNSTLNQRDPDVQSEVGA